MVYGLDSCLYGFYSSLDLTPCFPVIVHRKLPLLFHMRNRSTGTLHTLNEYTHRICPGFRGNKPTTKSASTVEHRIGFEILNKMTALGMPDTYWAG